MTTQRVRTLVGTFHVGQPIVFDPPLSVGSDELLIIEYTNSARHRTVYLETPMDMRSTPKSHRQLRSECVANWQMKPCAPESITELGVNQRHHEMHAQKVLATLRARRRPLAKLLRLFGVRRGD